MLPCAIGAGAGLALAFAFVYGVGPNGALSHDASSEALAASGFAGVAAIVAIAAVSTVSFLRHSEHHRRRFAVLGALPWELILIALSLVILERLRRGGAAVADLSPDTEAPSLLLFAFPVAFLAGFVALVARGRSCSCWAGPGTGALGGGRPRTWRCIGSPPGRGSRCS